MATAMNVAIGAKGGPGHRPVRLIELIGRDARDLRPEALGLANVEVVVQIEPDPESRLVDVEERTKLGTEEADQIWVRVGEPHRTP